MMTTTILGPLFGLTAEERQSCSKGSQAVISIRAAPDEVLDYFDSLVTKSQSCKLAARKPTRWSKMQIHLTYANHMSISTSNSSEICVYAPSLCGLECMRSHMDESSWIYWVFSQVFFFSFFFHRVAAWYAPASKVRRSKEVSHWCSFW